MLASTAIRDARRAGLPAQSLTPLGSLRRFAPAVGDVALLAVAPAADHAEVLTGFARLPAATGLTLEELENATGLSQIKARVALPLHRLEIESERAAGRNRSSNCRLRRTSAQK